MYMVIFGAGASYGCQSKQTPPLGDDLIHALKNEFPHSWGKLKVSGDDNGFEYLMRKTMGYYKDGKIFPGTHGGVAAAKLNQELARFLAKFEPEPDCLYTRFLSEIRDKNSPICITTLNYDILLQRAAVSCNKKIVHPGLEFIFREAGQPLFGIPVFLPHGSAGLVNHQITFRENTLGEIPGLQGMIELDDIRSVHMELDQKSLDVYFHNNIYNPIMSVYHDQKPTISNRSIIDRVRNYYFDECIKMKKIIIIGMRYQSHDNHIFEAIARSNAEIVVCSGEKDERDYELAYPKRVKCLGGYWKENYEAVMKELVAP